MCECTCVCVCVCGVCAGWDSGGVGGVGGVGVEGAGYKLVVYFSTL